jgi:filamentous hemagglutinin family protein
LNRLWFVKTHSCARFLKSFIVGAMRAKVCLFLFPLIAGANPSGHQVMHGQAEIVDGGLGCHITASDKAIIHWQTFSNEPREAIRFFLPSPGAAVLNRVVGGDASHILGELSANGSVFLVNPNGIVFGSESKINTMGFVASTFDVLDQAFIEDKEMTFSGSSEAKIMNLGMIIVSEKDLLLISKHIENGGSLSAAKGTVGLGCGGEIVIRPDGARHLYVQPKVGAESVLINSGKIEALHVELASEGNLYGLAFKHSGSIDALGTEEKGGAIYLAIEKGQTYLDGPIKGKAVDLSGESIALLDNGRIDSPGGEIVLGGDQTRHVYIGPRAAVRANGGEEGNGGKVVVLASEATRFFGEISAEGGKQNGDGGFVEVSSRGELVLEGQVSTLAPHGETGIFLIDPTDVTINALGPNNNITTSLVPPDTFYFPMAAAAPGVTVLTSGTILAALATNNVIVQTSAAGANAGNISWLSGAAITWVMPRFLALLAHNDVTVNSSLSCTSGAAGGNILFVSGWDGTTTAQSFLNGTFGPASYGNPGAFTANLLLTTTAGAVTINSNNGKVQMFGDNINVATNGAAGLSVTAPVGGITANAQGTIVVQPAAGPFNINITSLTSGSITFNAGGDISLLGSLPGGIAETRITSAGPMTMTSTGGDVLIQAGDDSGLCRLRTTGNNATLTVEATAGDITVGGGLSPTIGNAQAFVEALDGNVSFTAGGAINVLAGEGGSAGADQTRVEAQGVLHSVTFVAGGPILVQASQTHTNPASFAHVLATGPITFTSGGPDITLLGSTHDTAAARVSSPAGPIVFNVPGDIFLFGGSGTGSPAQITTTTGDITFNATAPSGTIQLLGGTFADQAEVATMDGNIVFNARNYDIIVQGGTNNNSHAAISSLTGDITLGTSAAPIRSLTIQGGSPLGGTVMRGFVSTRDGTTRVVTTGDLVIRGGGADRATAQLGYNTVGNTATGNIIVDVGGTLLVQGGTRVTCHAQLGHILGNTAASPSLGSATGNISVTVHNNGGAANGCRLIGGTGAGSPASAHIGHGGQFSDYTTISGTLDLVVERGNLQIQGGFNESFAHVGQGCQRVDNTFGTVLSVATVQVLNGDLVILRPTAAGVNSHGGVFHFAPSILSGSSLTVEVSGNIRLHGFNEANQAFIGCWGTNTILGGGVLINSPVTVCANGSLFIGQDTITPAAAGAAGIGYSAVGSPLASCVTDCRIGIAGNVTMAPNTASAAAGEAACFIGTPNSVTLGGGPFTSRLFLAVGGTVTMFGDVVAPAAAVTENTEIYGLGDTIIGIQGALLCQAGFRDARISSRLQTPLSTLTLRSPSNVVFQNSSAVAAPFGRGRLGSTPLAGQGGNIDLRTASDLFLASDTTQTAAAAFIFIEGGHILPAGGVWTSTGAQLTSVAGIPVSIPFSLGFAAPLNANSAAFGPDVPNNLGTVTIDTARYNQAGAQIFAATIPATLTTINGDITVHSADRFQSTGLFSNLTLGPAVNSLGIVTVNGDIEIFGGTIDDSFHDITIPLGAVAIPWTTGTILVSANNNLTVDTTISNVTGAASFITLRADNNDTNVDGPGILSLTADVISNAGTITLDSGFNAPGGISSILQTGGTVNSNGGFIRIQAVGNITLSGNAVSVTSGIGNSSIESSFGTIFIEEDVVSTTGNVDVLAVLQDIDLSTATGSGGSISTTAGNITMTAGNDIFIRGDPTTLFTMGGFIHTYAGNNTTVTENILQMGPAAASQDILMISGVDMFLMNADITSLSSPVTLVVDNNFPAPPGIGPGRFIMGSTVNSGPGQPLRIFTARQQAGALYNQIAVGSLFNGVDPYSAPYFYPIVPIFTDTPYEVWCVYFSFPFPYPQASLGFPFAIFYKPCENLIVSTGNRIISETLFALTPEYLEWPDEFRHFWRFLILYNRRFILDNEYYWLQRRRIRFIHEPYVSRVFR